MQTRREYAASLGLAIAGARGRMGREAHEAIAKAEAEGMRFKETASASKPKAVKEDGEAKEDAPKEREVGFPPIVDKRFPDATWQVRTEKKPVTISGAEVCRVCFYSLDYHICNTPQTLFDGQIVPVING